jgi:hypothetical protein
MMSVSMHGQDLKQHQWKNRLIVIVASEENNAYLKEQLATLSTDSKGCADRNLLIYQVLPERYNYQTAPIYKDTSWNKGTDLHKKFQKQSNSFAVYLIGLDGGIKMTSSKPWSLKTIFDTIDSMPMRVSENGK